MYGQQKEIDGAVLYKCEMRKKEKSNGEKHKEVEIMGHILP